MVALPPPQLIAGALTLIAQVAQSRSRDQYEIALAQLRAGVLHDLIDAVIHKRVDAVRVGFESILKQYADQAEHFMRQQDRYAEEELKCDDSIRRLELQSRMRTVDNELQCIRIDGQMLYVRMIEALHHMGGSSHGFAQDVISPLALTAAPVN